jgi:hypothetical protein
MAQTVEILPSKCEALSSNPGTVKNKTKKPITNLFPDKIDTQVSTTYPYVKLICLERWKTSEQIHLSTNPIRVGEPKSLC